jgi:hypothetical protein
MEMGREENKIERHIFKQFEWVIWKGKKRKKPVSNNKEEKTRKIFTKMVEKKK